MKRLLLIGLTALFFGASLATALDPLWILDIEMNYQDGTIYYSVVGDSAPHIAFLEECPLGWEWAAREWVAVGGGIVIPRGYGEDNQPAIQQRGICVGSPRNAIPSPDMEKLWI